jgi:hypothetical protein
LKYAAFCFANGIVAQPVHMDFAGIMTGYGERAGERAAALAAPMRAIAAIVRLDADAAGHPLRAPWLRVERETALAAALRETGHEGDPQSIIAARLGAMALPCAHAQLADIDDRARRWASITQRNGPPELRALGSWSVWAARLARVTKVDISSARRTLEQATELGLAAGDGLAAAMAEVDALLARFDEPMNRQPSGPHWTYRSWVGPDDRPGCAKRCARGEAMAGVEIS